MDIFTMSYLKVMDGKDRAPFKQKVITIETDIVYHRAQEITVPKKVMKELNLTSSQNTSDDMYKKILKANKDFYHKKDEYENLYKFTHEVTTEPYSFINCNIPSGSIMVEKSISDEMSLTEGCDLTEEEFKKIMCLSDQLIYSFVTDVMENIPG